MAKTKKRPKSKPTQPSLPGMPSPEPPGTARVFPMQFQVGDKLSDETGEWQVVGRPSTTGGGKKTEVRVQRADKPGQTGNENVGLVQTGDGDTTRNQMNQPWIAIIAMLAAGCATFANLPADREAGKRR